MHRLKRGLNPDSADNEQMGWLDHNSENPVPRNTMWDGVLEPEDFIFAGYVECFPLFSILTALNVTLVDYFSLDVQGLELKVLEAIPFDRLTIKVSRAVIPHIAHVLRNAHTLLCQYYNLSRLSNVSGPSC
jgi:hypothetical protein